MVQRKKTFPLIIRLASLPNSWPEQLLGDCITEGLARFIVSTYAGDLRAIKTLIETKTHNEWSRDAALRSLLGLVVTKALTRDAVVGYYRALFSHFQNENDLFNAQLISAAVCLHPAELMREINQLYAHDSVDESLVDRAFVETLFA